MRDLKFAQTSYRLSANHKLLYTKDANCDRHTIMACGESLCTHRVHSRSIDTFPSGVVGRVCVIPLRVSDKVCPLTMSEPPSSQLDHTVMEPSPHVVISPLVPTSGEFHTGYWRLGNPIRGGSEVRETPPAPTPRIGAYRGSEVQPTPPPCCLGVRIKIFKNHQNQPKHMGRRHGRHSKQTQHQNRGIWDNLAKPC